ncbi:MAG: ABC transporter substrate-binding protein [Dehalococcoidia bacterium]|nr:ABC transporter substrate-binding protein [Dehalococcoidia bacterium]
MTFRGRLGRLSALAWVPVAATLLFAACTDEDPAPAPAVSQASSVPATSATPYAPPRKAVFMAGFRPQANLPFVAAYLAKSKGFFAEEGLDVEIQHSSGSEHLRLILEQKVDFTTGTAAQVVRRRYEDLPLRAIALFGQRGDQGYIVRADSGITGPADFRGKRVGFKSGVVPAELKVMLDSANVAESEVRMQAVGFDPRVFTEGQVDVYPVFINNEPFTVRKTGLAINVIDPQDFGVATLGLTLLAHSDTLRDDPEFARKFLRAMMRGALYARDHIDEGVQATLTYANGADPEAQRYLLETDLKLAARADGMGRSDLGQWQALEAVLRRGDVIDRPVDVSTAWDGSLINGLYEEGLGR